MSVRLRELIRSVRACKTAADERAVISKECALIRTAFKDEDNQFRHRNVAKLLFIHMLGYPTHFGQMECLKLIAGTKFSEKRVGYLGLMVLLDERQEVLMLATNSLKSDMNHQNQYIVGLALCALGNISSTDIARDLAPEVEKLLKNSNPYIRKKAALCAIRVFRKVPELMENFTERVGSLLNDRNHGVLITGISVIIEICGLEKEYIGNFKRLVPSLVRILKNLVQSGYAPEHDVSGITDPFLQVKILQLLRLLGKGDAEVSDEMNVILAQVATNTETTKNAGNAILYECVQTIMAIESESGLRVLAINILGRFLLNRDNNIRYVALNTLAKVVTPDNQAVRRHMTTIVDCLKDPDISIRRRALDLVYCLVNESNIRVLTRELLNYLLVADMEFKEDLVAKIVMIVEKYAPNRKYHIDTVIKLLTVAGQYVRDEVRSSTIALISQTSELHQYAVQKLFLGVKADPTQQILIQVAMWCVGEFGELLIASPAQFGDEEPVTITEGQVIDLMLFLLARPEATIVTKEYILTAAMKLTTRFSQAQVERLKTLLNNYRGHMIVELQQRACEYSNLFGWEKIRPAVLERMPPMELSEKDEKLTTEGSQPAAALPTPAAGGGPAAPAPAQPQAAPASDNLLDLLSLNDTPSTAPAQAPAPGGDIMADIFGSSAPAAYPTPTPAPAASVPAGGNNLLDLLGGPSPAAAAPAPTPQPVMGGTAPNMANLMGGGAMPGMDLMNGGGMGMPAAATPAPGGLAPMSVFEKSGFKITFELQAQPGGVTEILVKFANSNLFPITDLVFQAAVPKFIKLELKPPTSAIVPPSSIGQVTQSLRVTNTLQGQKPLLMRLKIDYSANGQTSSEFTEVNSFPPNL